MESEQLTEFKRGRIIGLREGGFFCRAIEARVQRNNYTVMRVESSGPTNTRKVGSGRRKVTSASDNRHLVRMELFNIEDVKNAWKKTVERAKQNYNSMSFQHLTSEEEKEWIPVSSTRTHLFELSRSLRRRASQFEERCNTAPCRQLTARWSAA
ncbi:hypothetical protein TNCV_1267701 [Trichonephila clavipes]|nr:hypothetical protein TNCV_1267701 [Trichonephila clavipes]